MTNITEIIEKAAKTYAKNSTAPDKETPDWIESDFKAGVEWATTDPEMMKAMLKPFGDWLCRNYKQIDAQVWKERRTTSDAVYTLYQVIAKYIQFITDKP